MCDYDAIRKMLSYWCEPDPCLEPGGYDDWRKRNDLDCIIASRDRRVPNDLVLNADLIFSLWVPLRATLNSAPNERWVWWREFEYGVKCPKENPKYECGLNSDAVAAGRQYATDVYGDKQPRDFMIKRHAPFLQEFNDHIDEFLPRDNEATAALERLFELGQTRANVMILLDRSWNSKRGKMYDYMPSFLDWLFGKYDLANHRAADENIDIAKRIEREKLQPFFENEHISRDCIRDLAGIGSLRCPHMNELKNSIPAYLSTCSTILERRGQLLEEASV